MVSYRRVIRRYLQARTRKPGEVWQTEKGNWRAVNSKGESPKTFKKKEDAEAYAKGHSSSEKEKGLESLLKKDVSEVFRNLDKKKTNQTEIEEFFSIPSGMKEAWTEVGEELSSSLKKGKVRKAFLSGMGKALDAALKTFTSNKPAKDLIRAVDTLSSVAGVVVVGEDLKSLKQEFTDSVYRLKKHYDKELKNVKDPKRVATLNTKYQKKYDNLKEDYESLYEKAVGYSEAKNYRMMAKVVANAFLPKEDQFSLSEEERKTGLMYLGNTIASTLLGGSNLVASGLASVLKGAMLPLLSSSLGSAVIGRLGAMATSALAFKIAHKGSQELEKAIDKDGKINHYLQDFVVGYKTIEDLEKDLENLKKKAMKEIKAIYARGLSLEEEERLIQKIKSDLEDEEVKITDAVVKGGGSFSKNSSRDRVIARFLFASVEKVNESMKKLLENLVREGLESGSNEEEIDLFVKGLGDYVEVSREI